MAKIDSKELLKRVKTKDKPERANVTFRFSTKLMDEFRRACEDQEVTPTSVLEEFMGDFLVGLGKKPR